MANYINDLAVSLNKAEESQYRQQGFKLVPGNLNQGAGGDIIRLWYKTGSKNPITRIQFSFTEGMTKGLSDAGYTPISKDLNAGTGGISICLWYKCGNIKSEVPIQDLSISSDFDEGAQRFKRYWEKIPCNLNKFVGGDNIFLFVKRAQAVYICDVTATSGSNSDSMLFEDGYIRMDQNTNKYGDDNPVFIWYRYSTKKEDAIQDLKLSINQKEYNNLQEQGYTPVNMNLTMEDGGNPMYLWYIKTSSDPIRNLTYITGSAKREYETIGATVLSYSIHGRWGGSLLYLCFNQ